jgi:hypothetical protein
MRRLKYLCEFSKVFRKSWMQSRRATRASSPIFNEAITTGRTSTQPPQRLPWPLIAHPNRFAAPQNVKLCPYHNFGSARYWYCVTLQSLGGTGPGGYRKIAPWGSTHCSLNSRTFDSRYEIGRGAFTRPR